MKSENDTIVDRFAALWDTEGVAPDVDSFLENHPDATARQQCDILLLDLHHRWRIGRQPELEDYFQQYPNVNAVEGLRVELIVAEFACRRSQGEQPEVGQFLERFPGLQATLTHSLPPADGYLPTVVVDSPVNLTNAGNTTKRNSRATGAAETAIDLPTQIGRYRADSLLGSGGFGCVYRATDEELNRLVAIKVPHRHRLRVPSDVETYLAEARILASLDHPAIVPVYDVGRTDDGACFVVSKLIDGCTLSDEISEKRWRFDETAKLIAEIGDALQYSHSRGLVHRDIKPANILIAADGKAFLADFGLALRDEDFGKDAFLVGTPGYMSPEQARGEGHRVDGRSDIFSLGVVLYQLLTGRRPFRADSLPELLQQITDMDARPPRQFDERIPKELERITLKALSKRVVERYPTARDFVEDLNHFLNETARTIGEGTTGKSLPAASTGIVEASDSPESTSNIYVVPNGLRSFGASDADFYLELLPGARDREGLPDIIRFWKTRVTERDPDKTFSVGLLYGPSGCGKSSLVKAGLLPRLADDVDVTYIEATTAETETRLLNSIRRTVCDALPDMSLTETLAALRRNIGGRKVLLVVDQFEQWLHAHPDVEKTELVQAFRQCDGEQLQCLIMVRDDFWMATTRFMSALEVPLVEGHNSSTLDLFDARHSRKVLAAFGHAFGTLPAKSSEVTAEQSAFLDGAVSELAVDGKLVCVQLALFAEMVKGKPWIPATLKDIGGIEGLGSLFLEETFSSSTSPPGHRLHETAARAVLGSLLPETGSEIKGHMRSHAELLAVSEYTNRPSDFAALIAILDRELRLITPTESTQESTGSATTPGHSNALHYQLTHDYLVPSLREWITRKQRESRSGRAALRLADQSALWNSKPETRYLPSFSEYCGFLLFTRKKSRSSQQQRMMRKAAWVFGIRATYICALLAVALIVGVASRQAIRDEQEQLRAEVTARQKATRARGLVDTLVTAEISQVPELITTLEEYREWADPVLRDLMESTESDPSQQLHAGIALVSEDDSYVEFLRDKLITATPHQFPYIRDALLAHKAMTIDALWKSAKDETKPPQQRFQAAAALATYDPDAAQWGDICAFVAHHLLSLPPSQLVRWQAILKPGKNRLLEPLGVVYRDKEAEERIRSFAAMTLAEYAEDEPDVLVELLADASRFQFPLMIAALSEENDRIVDFAANVLRQDLGTQGPERPLELQAREQSNLAIALCAINKPDTVWNLLRHRPNPLTRSYFIHSYPQIVGKPEIILNRIESETDASIRRALLLCLGEFDEKQLPARVRREWIPKLIEIYETDPDAGLHSAAEWLLKSWGQHSRLAKSRESLRGDEQHHLAAETYSNQQWYLSNQGHTMMIMDVDRTQSGSPTTERGRQREEHLHQINVGRRIAVSSTEITRAQFTLFRKERTHIRKSAGYEMIFSVGTPDSPQVHMTWYEASEYCNWLSEKEGIEKNQWCYEPNKQGRYASGMKPRDNYRGLSGYRLPTNAEWEFACRAGTVTSRWYGSDESLLDKYSWYLKNANSKAQPVGQLKPNDFGLFDINGNVMEWCHERRFTYPSKPGTVIDEQADDSKATDSSDRMMRGSCMIFSKELTRSAHRWWLRTGMGSSIVGFRPVRTMPKD